MSTYNRSRIAKRAWHLFKTQLGGVGCIYRNRPRLAFSLAMKQAWAEERQLVAAAAIPAEVRAERIAILRAERAGLCFYESNVRMNQAAAEIAAELRVLEAVA